MGRGATARVARKPEPPRRQLGRPRRQLRALLGERRARRALPLRRPRAARARAHRAARVHRRDLARLPAGRAPGPALRLSRLRPLRAGARPPLQPPQAAARSLCQGAARRAALERRALRLPDRAPQPPTSPSTAATTRPACPSAWSWTPPSPGARTARPARRGTRRSSTSCTCAATRCATRTCRLRCAAPSRGLARPAVIRHLRELGVTAVELLARSTPSSTTAIWSSAACATTGATTRSASSRPDPRYLGTDTLTEFKTLRAAPARRGHRGDPRRRLQPHRRGQPPRPDALLPRHRQRLLLPARPGRPALLRGLHRLRQRAEPAPSRACCSW